MSELKHVYSRSQVCRKANALKKRLAAIHGGTPKQYASEAFRRAWASEKSLTAEIVAMRQRVLDCVADLKADQQPLARARREREMQVLDAEIAASIAKANAIVARLNQRTVRRAA